MIVVTENQLHLSIGREISVWLITAWVLNGVFIGAELSHNIIRKSSPAVIFIQKAIFWAHIQEWERELVIRRNCSSAKEENSDSQWAVEKSLSLSM